MISFRKKEYKNENTAEDTMELNLIRSNEGNNSNINENEQIRMGQVRFVRSI